MQSHDLVQNLKSNGQNTTGTIIFISDEFQLHAKMYPKDVSFLLFGVRGNLLLLLVVYDLFLSESAYNLFTVTHQFDYRFSIWMHVR